MKSPVLLLIFMVPLIQLSIYAADFAVNTATDLHDADTADGICLTSAGDCSIRAAVEQANTVSTNDRVLFDLPANSAITLTTANGGQMQIVDARGTLEIIGTGANNLTIDGGRTGFSRIFEIVRSLVTISGVKLTGGYLIMSTNGGAIRATGGILTLNAVEVTDNISTSGGPATNGGAMHFSGGTVLILNSTISHNQSADCGGFAVVNGGVLYMANTTVSHNSTVPNQFPYGGGLCVINSNAIIRNSTIVYNTATRGGGIYAHRQPPARFINLGNTIVAGNRASLDNPEMYVTGWAEYLVSDGHNMVGDSTGDAADTFVPITYHPTDILDTNPLLGALAYNGGSMPTHALLFGSPAIDAGDNAKAVNSFDNTPLLMDQRGRPRIIDRNGDGIATVDIGAVETITTATVSGRVTNASGQGIPNGSVEVSVGGNQIYVARTNGFGYYVIGNVAAGVEYSIGAFKKGYQFDSQAIVVNDDLSEIHFIAAP